MNGMNSTPEQTMPIDFDSKHPIQDLETFYESQRATLIENLKDLIEIQRNIEFLNLLPKLILLHHQQREVWLTNYVDHIQV